MFSNTKDMYPEISIITPVFESEKFIKLTIESVLSQTYQNWEVIFWDNNSNDRSKSIVKSYKDSRIKYFISKKKMPESYWSAIGYICINNFAVLLNQFIPSNFFFYKILLTI